MSKERIILMERHCVSLKSDATGAPQIRFGASWEPGWFLDTEQAERLCLHILTDASDELIITGVPAGPEQAVYPGALLVTKDQDRWVFAHSCEEPLPEMIVRSRLWKYRSNWESFLSWADKPALAQKFLTRPKEPQVEKLQVWDEKPLYAKRMALALLEGIGRQAWIPVFSMVGSKPRRPRESFQESIARLLLILIGIPLF